MQRPGALNDKVLSNKLCLPTTKVKWYHEVNGTTKRKLVAADSNKLLRDNKNSHSELTLMFETGLLLWLDTSWNSREESNPILNGTKT